MKHSLPKTLMYRTQDLFEEFLKASGASLVQTKRLKTLLMSGFRYSDFFQKSAQQYPRDLLTHLDELYLTVIEPNVHDADALKASLLTYYQNFSSVLDTKINALCLHDKTLLSAETQLQELIRIFRQINMSAIACLDFSGIQCIKSSLLGVSLLADAIINNANKYLYQACIKRYGEPENKQALLVLAMGKLGGQELNFSSDIDLIFTYPSKGVTKGHTKEYEHQVFFTKLAQKLIQCLDKVSQHGRAYRVDMRLRPLGESGPIVLSFAAFETYYQDQGREWERFAMQKARVLGHSIHKKELEDIIRPFVYRKYQDFTTISSIREMKSLINKEVRRKQITNNIKLGRGGIREVEFFIQSLQLMYAGKHPQCQYSSILKSMTAIASLNLQGDVNIEQLQKNYLYLRRIEHYIQAFNDEQTQTLPNNDINQLRLCELLKDDRFETTCIKIKQAMQEIHQAFASIVEDANAEDMPVEASEQYKLNIPSSFSLTDTPFDKALEDLWCLNIDDSAAFDMLSSLFDDEAQEVAQSLVQSTSHFKTKAKRLRLGARAESSINKLIPLLIKELIHKIKQIPNSHIINGLQGIFGILQTITGRVTYVDLLLEYPDVRTRLIGLCQKSPWIAQEIAKHPILLDEILHPQYLLEANINLTQWKQNCKEQLQQILLRIDPDDEEQILESLREFKLSEQLRIAAADVMDNIQVNIVSDKLSLLAEVIVEQVIEIAWRFTSTVFGQPQHSGQTKSETLADNTPYQLAIVAYGKFGGIELSYGSDLDLVFLYDAETNGSTDQSGSRKQISNQEFYIKLVQRFCHICNTNSYSGILYEIDLRLRPSGNSGLLISHIDSFQNYQLNTAWTWEHQALLRTRAIWGRSSLISTFGQIRKQVLSQVRDTSKLKLEVLEMREKMRQHLLHESADSIDLKQTRGGIVDIEFIVQYLVLSHAHEHEQLYIYSDNLRLLDALVECSILEQSQAHTLRKAYLSLRKNSHKLQLANTKLTKSELTTDTELTETMPKVDAIFQQILQD